MADRRWTNNTQPQTLQIAVVLLYIFAVEMLIFSDIFVQAAFHGFSTALRILLPVIGVAGAFGIANEHKWGYWLGIAASILPLVARFYIFYELQRSPLSFDLAGLLFEVALVALLLHRQSRDYQRLWFK